MVRTVLSEGFELYRRIAVRAGAATLLIFLPFAAVLAVLELVAPDGANAEQGAAILDAVGSLLLFVPLASILSILLALRVERDEEPRPAAAIMDAFGILPAYVITQVLVLFVVFALPGAIIAVGFAADAPLLVSVGAGVLIASAIINGVRLAVATVAVAVGDARYAPALRRAAQISRGRYWSVLGVLAITGLIALSIALALTAIPLAAPAGAGRVIADAIVGVIANAVTVPLVAVLAYRLYRNLAAERPAVPTA